MGNHIPSPLAGTRAQRIARVARQLKAFEWLAPEFRRLHPLEATSPQECSEIAAHVFRSLQFDTNYHIPSYRNWLDADVVRNLPAYRFTSGSCNSCSTRIARGHGGCSNAPSTCLRCRQFAPFIRMQDWCSSTGTL